MSPSETPEILIIGAIYAQSQQGCGQRGRNADRNGRMTAIMGRNSAGLVLTDITRTTPLTRPRTSKGLSRRRACSLPEGRRDTAPARYF